MKARGYLLATTSGLAAAATAAGGVAQAADMGPPVKAPLAVPPAASWAGWYVGLNAGANWQNATNSSYDGGLLTGTTNATGFIGGGQIGYNWQDGNFIFGLEGDIDGLTGKGAVFGQSGGDKSYSNQITWLSTVRGRMGLAVGNTMAYATGGLAVGEVKNSQLELPSHLTQKSVSKANVGWTVGGGIEHILWNSHWTVGLEGLFVDLGQSSSNTVPGAAGFTKTAHFSNQAVIGRLKLNYKW